MTQVEKLELILEKIKTLKPKQFNFAHFVSDYDEENGCGTVCCIVGWFPKFFPKSGFKWKDGELRSEIYETKRTEGIQQHLCQLLNLPLVWVEYLFFGYSKKPNNNLPYLTMTADLARVIYVWEKAIAYLKKHPSALREKYSLT